MTDAPRPLDELLELYRGPVAQVGYDESVTQLEHALQCAALASQAGASDTLVAAALLHDVGHLLTAGERTGSWRDDGDLHHEDVGGAYLRQWFGPSVTAPVVLHVAAKRYLCGAEPSYAEQLSPGSVHSLAAQGGPMDHADRHRFEQRPGWDDAVRLRRWDDDAKVVGAHVAPLEDYEELLRSLAAATGPSG